MGFLVFEPQKSCYHLSVINLRKTLQESHALLSQQGIAHALIGGFALAVYGQHRATVDIDFLADGTKKDLIKSSFLKKAFTLKYESNEVLQFTGPGFVDILLANRPLSQEMLKQAIQNQELGIYVVRPEDIVGLKIQAYKNDSSGEYKMKTMEEYFQFLEQYWQMFQPPAEPKPAKEYTLVLL